ncbi:unnamed protein product, partial [marine sediment metagenome]
MDKFKVTSAQFRPIEGKVEENIAKIAEYMRQTHEVGAKIIAFPEGSITGYMVTIEQSKKLISKLAEPISGPTLSKVADYAKRYNLYTVVGFIEKADVEKPYNSLVLISPDGEVIGVHRKTHLGSCDEWHEGDYFAEGN